jgi:cell division transport system permease protein
MSSTDTRPRYPTYDLRQARTDAETAPAAPPGAPAPVVPPGSIAGRSLLAVIAIMSLLASLTLGAVVLVRTAAGDWQAEVAREMTIQIRPAPGRDLDAEVLRASLLARSTPGIRKVRPYSKQESQQLLRPWLGDGLPLDELPIPRLIVVTLDDGAQPDLDGLRRALAAQVPGASLDDHRAWVERMRAMTRTAVLAGVGVLSLMLLATVLLVVFATRGAMAANRGIVEVLHFVGARNKFISGEFQRHFLLLGLKGSVLGGGLAAGFFLSALLAGSRLRATTEGQELAGLFGSLRLAPDGYAGIAGVMLLIAAVAAITSRWTVQRTLNTLD